MIEDGVHFGYAVNATNTSISFDRADIQADGPWTNDNPKVRTLPVTPNFWSSNLFPSPANPSRSTSKDNESRCSPRRCHTTMTIAAADHSSRWFGDDGSLTNAELEDRRRRVIASA